VPPMVAIEIARKATSGTMPSRYVPCTRRVREELSLELEVSLKDAVRRTHDWFAHRECYE